MLGGCCKFIVAILLVKRRGALWYLVVDVAFKQNARECLGYLRDSRAQGMNYYEHPVVERVDLPFSIKTVSRIPNQGLLSLLLLRHVMCF